MENIIILTRCYDGHANDEFLAYLKQRTEDLPIQLKGSKLIILHGSFDRYQGPDPLESFKTDVRSHITDGPCVVLYHSGNETRIRGLEVIRSRFPDRIVRASIGYSLDGFGDKGVIGERIKELYSSINKWTIDKNVKPVQEVAEKLMSDLKNYLVYENPDNL